ncbi:hypothetical protein [Companilactobacillus sp. DQM5]|uniref:hypothetical protein n=1 Tax=Companilactobacillus sp. DQM5 TaxID=3463359 RepID=UPI0040596000
MSFLDKLFPDEVSDNKHTNIADSTQNKPEEKSDIKIVKPKPQVTFNNSLSNHDKRVQLEEKMASLATEYSSLRGSLKKTLFAERDEFQSSKNTTEQKIADLTANQEKYSKQKEALLAEDDADLLEKLESNKQQLLNQTELIEKYQEQNNGVEDELKNNNDDIKEVENAIESNKQAESNLSEEIKNETDLKKMYELMEKQKKSVAHLYEDREKLSKSRDKLLKKNEELTSENQQLLNNIEEATNISTNIKKQITQLDTQIKTNTQKRTQNISQLENQLSIISKELNNNKNQLLSINKSIKSLDSKIQETFNSNYLVRDVSFSTKKTYAILQPSNDKSGQLTKEIYNYISQINKSKALTLTNLENTDTILPEGKIFNLYADLQFSSKPTEKRVSIQDRPDWKTLKNENETKILDQSDNLLMTVHFKNQKISSIDYFTDEHLNKTNIYNQDGILSKTKFYTEKETIDEETYYRTDGSTVLTKQFESEQLTSVQLFDEDGLQTNVFSNEYQLAKWWITNIKKDYENLVLIGDPTDDTFKNMSSDKELNIESLVYLENVHSNIGRIRALLHSKPIINDILVTTQDDLQSIEDITDRDINVSVIKKPDYEANSAKLPNSLI